jgi:hypothetical protein
MAQIRGTPQCPPEAAEPLLRWMVGIAQLKRFFFSGYVADPIGACAVRMQQENNPEDDDLVLRWSRPAETVLVTAE